MRKFYWAAALCCTCNLALAEQFAAQVIAVMDGDTVLVLHDGKRVKLRLANIDAPEMAQGFGSAAKLSLVDLVLLKTVRATTADGLDKYQRAVALLSMDGRSVNEEQVRRGMAWASVWRQKNGGVSAVEDHASVAAASGVRPAVYSSAGAYTALQREARTARRGLWAQAHPLPPWRWRKTHSVPPPAP